MAITGMGRESYAFSGMAGWRLIGCAVKAGPTSASIALLVIVGLAIGVLPGGALAGDWKISTGVGVAEDFTDNTGLVNDEADKNSELTTTITPNLSIRGRGGRVAMDLNYSLNQVYFRQQEGRSDTRHNLAASGNAEIWDRQVFIDAQASISRQVTDTGAVTSASAANESVNRTTVQTLNLTPTFVHHFGTYAETRSTNPISIVRSGSGGASSTVTKGSNFVINSGREFTSILWSGSLSQNKTVRDGGAPSTKNTNIDATLTYVYSRRLSLTGGFGFQKVEDGSLDQPPVGKTWTAGFSTQPGSKLSLNVNYNSRDNSQFVSFDAAYRFSSRTSVTASLSQDLTNVQSQTAADTSFIGTNILGELIDTRTGLPVDASALQLGQTDSTFVSRTFNISASTSRGRNSYSAGFTNTTRDTDATGIVETSTSLNTSWSRTFTPKVSGSVSANYSMTDPGIALAAETTNMSLNASVSLAVLRDTSLSVNYRLLRNRSSTSVNDVTENAIGLSLNRNF